MNSRGDGERKRIQSERERTDAFQLLLAKKRCQRQNELQGITLQKIHTDTLDVISSNQCFQGILLESLEDGSVPMDQSDQAFGKSFSVSGCIEMLRHKAKPPLCPIDMLAAEVMSDKLLTTLSSLYQERGITRHLLNSQQKEIVKTTVKIISSLLAESSFNRVHFSKCLSAHDIMVPLEVLYSLHISHTVSFNTYLACCTQDDKVCHKMSSALLEIAHCITEQDQSAQMHILSVLCGILLSLGYPELSKHVDCAKNVLQELSQAILIEAVTKCKSACSEKITEKRLDVLEIIRCIDNVPRSSLIKFFSSALYHLLYDIPSVFDVCQWVGSLTKYRYATLDEVTRTQLSQFLHVFEPSAILEVIKQVFSKEKVNFGNFFSLISVFIVNSPNAKTLIEGCMNSMITDALASNDEHMIGLAFLVIRQACMEGPHVFKPYSMWFNTLFNDPSMSGLSNKRAVQFFFNFLTKLVPYDPVEYLKVHVIKAPHIPANLRSHLMDYTDLAKTRLMDLKEPIELSETDSSASSNKDGEEKQQEQSYHEVERVIGQFSKTGKVPASVMEASIFRKPYFIGRFLPALLLPRKVPDTPDIREKLISTLSRANKIPNSMLAAYHKACRKLAQEHDIQGNDSDEDSQLSCFDKLSKSLSRLPGIVLPQGLSAATGRVSSHLSLVAGYVMKVFTNNEPVSLPSTTPVVIDPYAPCVDSRCLKVVDAMLNAFCRTMAAVRRSQQMGTDKFSWSSQFVSMVAGFPTLHASLCYRLWTLLCTHDGSCLSVHHIHGLAAFLCHMSTQRNLFKPVIVKSNQSHKDTAKHDVCFVARLLDALPFSTRRHMDIAIRFYCAFIQHASEAFAYVTIDKGCQDNDGRSCQVPLDLVKKLWYFHHRLLKCAQKGSSKNQHLSETTFTILQRTTNSSIFAKLLVSTTKVSFDEWLSWEMMIRASDDIMPGMERRLYHHMTTTCRYLAASETEKGVDPKVACSTLLNKLLGALNRDAPAVTNNQCCCESGMSVDTDKQTIEDMIHLLKELLPFLSRTHTKPGPGASHHPWLIKQYQERIDHVTHELCVDETSREVLVGAETVSLVELWLHLPPYLIFVDDPLVSPTPDSITCVTRFINTALRSHVTEMCCLQLSVTLHLMKAVFSFDMPRITESPVTASRILQQLMHECPMFLVSLQHYWPQVKATVSTLYDLSSIQAMADEVENLHDFVMSICYKHKSLLTETHQGSPHILGASLYQALRTLDVKPEAFMSRPEKTRDYKQITVCVFACVVAELSVSAIQGRQDEETSTAMEISKKMLELVPECLMVFDKDQHQAFVESLRKLREFIVVRHRDEILPVIFFSIVTGLAENTALKLSSNAGFSRIVIHMENALRDLRKTCLDEGLLRSCGKIFQVDFTIKVSAFIKKYLHCGY
ncbi:Fanconi anemia group A protein homolog isoform X2 [Nematostella vectensis]|uniref:Fanconi anemia group A protein homolog isoform X2 n=1 Tax=Nematostella vectensis TaxID=45351 RepID=UPI00207759D2|nr:Fanconi anemia group A protein homolog isoform X2 [Nematostella vectensis]